jgi:anti-sigma factor ChrR (cupin superfamily)
MADRFSVKPRDSRGGSGGRGGQIKITVWVIHDSITNKVAKGTTGFQGVGGYATQSEAKSVANQMNRDHVRALQEKALRERKRRSE